jgi:hypothetical protein
LVAFANPGAATFGMSPPTGGRTGSQVGTPRPAPGRPEDLFVSTVAEQAANRVPDRDRVAPELCTDLSNARINPQF